MAVNSSIVALILTAGYSSRMGQFKPLLPIGEALMIEATIATFLQAGINDIRVVVGYRADELMPVAAASGARYIMNENYREGMFSSVQAGVSSLDDHHAFFLLPGDCPLICSETVAKMIDMYRRLNTAILYPTYCGRRGHPPLISAGGFAKKILYGQTSNGLRGLLDQYESDAHDIEVHDDGILIDLDNDADYKAVLERSALTDIPGEEHCLFLLDRHNVPKDVVAHSRRVGIVSREIAIRLKGMLPNLNPDLVFAAGLLHDIAKGKPHHAEEGMRILKTWGYKKIAAIAGSHMDISVQEDTPLTEKEILYLADKLIQGVQYVGLEERMQRSMEKFACQASVAKSIEARFVHANMIKDQVENLLGCSIESALKVTWSCQESSVCIE